MYIKRTLIIPAENAPLARTLATALAGPPGEGMWLVGLSADGNAPATHYISSGPVGAEFETVLTNADMLWGAIVAAGMDNPENEPYVTEADCIALVNGAVVVDVDVELPFDTMERLGLELVSEWDSAPELPEGG